jgi:hypothetical protein
MRPTITLSTRMVQTLQHRVIDLLVTELSVLDSIEFTPDELRDLGWTPERVEMAQASLAKLQERIKAGGLTVPEPLTEQETGQV